MDRPFFMRKRKTLRSAPKGAVPRYESSAYFQREPAGNAAFSNAVSSSGLEANGTAGLDIG